MAGAKKESKTARASVRAGAGGAGGARVFGDMKRFTPLGGGFCYFAASDGKNLHLKVDSEELLGLLSAAEGSDRAKINAEVAELAAKFGTKVPAWKALSEKLTAGELAEAAA
ncbi:hypothetical protein [Catenulispora pinisilvae]|uniref:hypothetical protein n=1 Tax=Catenulispora pinisilvae TaxID=2705253 RepID=UPI001890EF2E|nr:hypothetical protein [Catenulispora pinisilvae]